MKYYSVTHEPMAHSRTKNSNTHSLLLGSSLLLRSRLLLGRGLLLGSLLGLGSSGGLLLEVGTELVRGLDLGEVAIGNHLLEGVQVGTVHPLLIRGEVRLHVLLDGDGGGAGAVLELSDGSDDSSFVRHG